MNLSLLKNTATLLTLSLPLTLVILTHIKFSVNTLIRHYLTHFAAITILLLLLCSLLVFVFLVSLNKKCYNKYVFLKLLKELLKYKKNIIIY